jgi:hypothetical protein
MDDLEQRVAAIIHAETNTIGNEAFNLARAIIPMVLEHAAKAVENQRPVHHSFVRRTHAAAAIRAIGARP